MKADDGANTPAAAAAIAPCTHQARCGMLALKNARHWCHHFAPPPEAAFRDARWAEFRCCVIAGDRVLDFGKVKGLAGNMNDNLPSPR